MWSSDCGGVGSEERYLRGICSVSLGFDLPNLSTPNITYEECGHVLNQTVWGECEEATERGKRCEGDMTFNVSNKLPAFGSSLGPMAQAHLQRAPDGEEPRIWHIKGTGQTLQLDPFSMEALANL